MPVIIQQLPDTRERAQALMRWLIEAEGPGVGIAELADVALSGLVRRRGLDLPDVLLTPSGGAACDVIALLGECTLQLPDDPRTNALIALVDQPLGDTSLDFRFARTWGDAVLQLYASIATPSRAEDLGPRWPEPETAWGAPGEPVPPYGLWERIDLGPQHGPSHWERLD